MQKPEPVTVLPQNSFSAFISRNGLLLLSFLIALVVMFYRRPDAFYASQFWAEEGSVFYSEAYHEGLRSIFNPCVGYFHLFPRLVACLAAGAHFPLQAVPFLFCYAWLFMLLTLLFYTWKRLDFSQAQRFFISITVVMIPLQSEVFMNLTNVQWIMAFFPVIIFSAGKYPPGKKWFIADLVILLLSGLTGPNFTVLLPVLVLLYFLKKRELFSDRRRLFLLVFSLLLAMISVIALLQYGSVNRTAGTFSLLNKGFVQQIFVQYAFLFIGKFAFRIPFLLMVIAVLLMAGGFFWLARKTWRKKNNAFELVSLCAGLLFLVTTFVAYRNNPALLSPFYRGIRNFYIPAVTFIWVLIRFAEEFRYQKFLLSGLMLLFAAETVLFIGPLKFQQYDLAGYNEALKTNDTLSIPINPSPWSIDIDKTKMSVER